MQKTITSVNEEPRHWTSDDGKISLAFLTVTFADGSQGSIACKPENAENVTKILQGLKGKPSEFDLEPKAEYNGVAQFKVKNYPGKPGQQDGQRGSGGGGARRHDPETNASIEAQVSAKIAGELAVALIGAGHLPRQEVIHYVAGMTSEIVKMIRSAATGEKGGKVAPPVESESTGAPSSGGPLPPPDSDEADEGVAPGVAPSWPMTDDQKAQIKELYGSQAAALKSARLMFPEITKFSELSEDQAAALIEDKQS